MAATFAAKRFLFKGWFFAAWMVIQAANHGVSQWERMNKRTESQNDT